MLRYEVLSMSKTYTKSNLIHSVAKANGYSKQKSKQTAESLLEIIKRTLESGEDVLISGFGKFCVKDKQERRGRNPPPEIKCCSGPGGS